MPRIPISSDGGVREGEHKQEMVGLEAGSDN